MKRKQKWITFRGNQRQAEEAGRAGERSQPRRTGGAVEGDRPRVAGVGGVGDQAAEAAGPHLRPITLATINNHLIPRLGALRVQQLKALDIERGTTRRPSAYHKARCNCITRSCPGALKAALRAGLVTRNVATLVNGKPQATKNHDQQRLAAWDVAEARTFLATAKAAGPQPAAFYALALNFRMPQERTVRAPVERSLIWTREPSRSCGSS